MFQRTDYLRIPQVRPLIPWAILQEEIPDQRAGLERGGEHARGDRGRARGAGSPAGRHGRPVLDSRLAAALDYAGRLATPGRRATPITVIVMRSYFEKPRTSVGWKGLINDPDLDESYHINKGLRLARKLLLDVNDMGLPTGVRVPRYPDPAAHRRPDVLGRDWRPHDREPGAPRAGLGLSMPVGFKNSTDGSGQDRGGRGAGGAVGALVPVGDEAGRVGDLPDHRE